MKESEFDLVNKAFERWYAGLDATPATALPTLRENMKKFPMHLLPFVTWDSMRPVRVKLKHENTNYRCTLHPYLGYGQCGVQVKNCHEWPLSVIFGNQNLGVKVVRYRYFKSKRWRTPKACHEAQAAFYTLKFK